MKSAESILIVDDENTVQKSWTEALEKQGFDIAQASSFDQAQSLFDHSAVGLALVNLKSNGHMRGLDLLEWIKENNPSTDVILVSSYSNLDSSISALRKGAYDYLVKPVNITEVVTRVNRCMTERQESAERIQVINQIEMMLNQLKTTLVPESVERSNHEHILETPDIIVDRRKRLVVQNGEPVQLSPTEFDMLDYLATNGDRVVSASELIRAVQGYEMDEMDARPIVRVNVRRLRQKIETDTANPRHILTVRSRGYRFAA
jgi:DNA-binding response OmpR family regulator